MEGARTNWNDDRLDRLADQVDDVRRSVDDLRGHVDDLRSHMDDRFDRLQTAMIVTLAGILAAFGTAFLGLQL